MSSPPHQAPSFKAAARQVLNVNNAASTIAARREAVLASWSKLQAQAAERKEKLEQAKSLQLFLRTAADASSWIAERRSKTSTDDNTTANMDARSKAHAALQTEINSYAHAITDLRASAEALTTGGHFAAASITARLEAVEAEWAELKAATEVKTAHLQALQQLLAFRRSADDLSAYLAERRPAATSTELGDDLEHCEVLQKRFADFINDITANEARFAAFSNRAVELLGGGHPEAASIETLHQQINSEWGELQRQASARAQRLADAHEVHAFSRDVDETKGRILEKTSKLDLDEYGSDLASVEALRRNHEGFERDLAALEDSVQALAATSQRLQSQFAESAALVASKQQDLEAAWDELRQQSTVRKDKLAASFDLQRFFNDHRGSTSWIADMKALLTADELATDVAGADALLQRHQEHRSEIDAREEPFAKVEDFGGQLISAGHYAAEDIKAKLESLNVGRKELADLWDARQQEFQQSYDQQVFLRDAEQIASWTATQESALAMEGVGDSLDIVVELLKKHDDFEKSLVAQQEKTKALDETANRLLAYNHFDADGIRARRDDVLAKRTHLDELAKEHRRKLEDSHKFQQFKQDADEAEAWIIEKLQTATDGSFNDPTNLRGKVQRHQAFEDELSANEGRITSVSQTADSLLADSHFCAEEIATLQKHINEQWKHLLEQSADKGSKLQQAYDQQQFNHAVDDIDGWCQEVETALAVSDLGKDLTSVQNLLKKHQLLEAEIAGHQDRIVALAKQADGFVAAGNFQGAAIKEKQLALQARYEALRAPAEQRRQQLEASQQLQQFYRDVVDEESWIKEKQPAASSTNLGNTLTAVQNLQKKHNALLAELSSRDKAIQGVGAKAKSLIGAGHYAADAISTRMDELKTKWSELNKQAQDRRRNLEESTKVQQYLTDANEAEAWMTEKEPIVTNDDYGKDEDSALALLKKHEAVESDLRAYQGTINSLASASKQCRDLTALVTESPAGSSPSTDASVGTAPVSVKALYTYKGKRDTELSVKKGEILTLVKKDNADWWRVQQGDQVGFVPANHLKELEDGSEAGSSGGSRLLRSNSTMARSASSGAGPETPADRQGAIEAQYAKLLAASKVRREKLQESQDLYQLNREIDEVESWMNDREAVASVPDLGNDIEHNEIIQKKFDDFLKDLAANETRVNVANDLAKKFIDQGHSEKVAIEARQEALNKRWGGLQDLAKQRSVALATAHDIHKFNRDVDETKVRLNEKGVVLGYDDYGKDVASVEILQRRHDGAMRDLAALDSKVQELRTAADMLTKSHPAHADEVLAKQEEIEGCWAELQNKADERKRRLEESRNYQQFLSDHRDLLSWLGGMHALASSEEFAQDAAGADELLKRHQELETEVDARADGIDGLKAFGQQLIGAGNHPEEVKEKLTQLASRVEGLRAQLAHRQQQLAQCKELQVFNRLAEQAEAWISTREAPLKSEDVGSSLDSAEALFKKHMDFEKTIATQKDKIAEVNKEAERLLAGGHYATNDIKARQAEVAQRWGGLLDLAEERKVRLDKAMELQQFLRDADEAEAWMGEKLQTASDQGYKDPTNLPGKLQKHQAFEAEVAANEERIFKVIGCGEELMGKAGNEGDTDLIESRIAKLRALWDSLRGESDNKGQKLHEANEQQQYNHGVEDIEFWLAEVESLLKGGDYGKDLASVKNLIKKHQLLEAEIAARKGRVAAIRDQAEAFVAGGHFDAINIRKKQEDIEQRYGLVVTLAGERSRRLDESLRLQKILRDIDDEEFWIKEKARSAQSSDFGKDLTGVQNLQKKHQTFETEVATHNEQIAGVMAEAGRVVAEGEAGEGMAAVIEKVDARRSELEAGWSELQELSRKRKDLLEQSLQYQLFNAEVDEEESWLNEKQTMVRSEDSPDTLSGAQGLLKKHEAFEADLEEHQAHVTAVREQGAALVKSNNYQKDKVRASVEHLAAQISDLSDRAVGRKAALRFHFEFLQFSREADSVEAWIADKDPQAASKDVGKDLPSVQNLMTKHEAFEASLLAFQARIDAFQATKDALVSSGNVRARDIADREAMVMKRWHALLAASATRKDALNKAQEQFQKIEDLFLTFAKKASQANSWFENAEEDLTDPVRVNSLDEIKVLRSAHSDFMASLATARKDFDELAELHRQLEEFEAGRNPYTWFSVESLEESWQNLAEVIKDRSEDLELELQRQEENENLRKMFAKAANTFQEWLVETRAALVEGSGTLEAQLEATKQKHQEVIKRKATLKSIEDLAAGLEAAGVYDNRHTDQTALSLAQSLEQLEQLAVRMSHNLQQQIEAKNATGISDEQMADYISTFKYFDKDGNGELDTQEFKAVLRSLGYSLPVVEEGQQDPEFEAILQVVDPDGSGTIDLNEFKNFIVQRESEKAESAADIQAAFAQAAGGKEYVLMSDLQRVLTPEQAQHCARHMPSYVDEHGIRVDGAFDFKSFVSRLFV